MNMRHSIEELLQEGYDARYGNMDSHAVVESVINQEYSVGDLIEAFASLGRQWQLPLIDAMRILAAMGYCSVEEAYAVLGMTRTMADRLGSEEYFKTVNALSSAPNSAQAVLDFVRELLPATDDAQRYLVFYAVALLAEKRTVAAAHVPDELFAALSKAAQGEVSKDRQHQFQRALAKFAGISTDAVYAPAYTQYPRS